jgi:hypothetical protein
METATPRIIPAEHDPAELARPGDEIAELAAHLDAATALPSGSHPRIRRPRRVGQRLRFVRGVTELARRLRDGCRA